jgi:hypothetical protein
MTQLGLPPDPTMGLATPLSIRRPCRGSADPCWVTTSPTAGSPPNPRVREPQFFILLISGKNGNFIIFTKTVRI